MTRATLSSLLTLGLVLILAAILLTTSVPGLDLQQPGGWITLGALLGTLASLQIIYRQQRHIDIIKVEPSLLQPTLDAISEGVLLLDKRERIILTNSAFAGFMGKTCGNLKNMPVSLLGWTYHFGYDNDLPWSKTLDDGSRQTNVQLCLPTDTGGEKVFLVDSAPVYDQQHRVCAVMVRFGDITQLEETNDQLEEMLGILKMSREEIQSQNEELQILAAQDPLTHCLNRRSFFEKFEIVFDKAQRDGHSLACIMADIDRFKTINDRYGHTRGDTVIRGVAECLRTSLRPMDIISRYGGEEFCIVLPGMDLESARQVAERTRERIEQLHIKDAAGTGTISVTSSFGVASLESGGASLGQLIEHADKALYRAKNEGRNRVIPWDDAHSRKKLLLDADCPAGQTDTPDIPPARRRAGTLVGPNAGSGVCALPSVYDSVTGLPNRKRFYTSLGKALRACRDSGGYLAVMILNLDMFKRINSELGYLAADQLLGIVSQRLLHALHGTDSSGHSAAGITDNPVFYLGGAEFGIILTGLDSAEFSEQVAGGIIAAITEKVEIDGKEIHLTCSTGTSLYPDDGRDVDTLLKHADTALYHTRLHGQYRYQTHGEEPGGAAPENLRLVDDLRQALATNDLELFYQPKINLATGVTDSMEALVRWRHPELGMIPPGEFIPLAERNGLIVPIGNWVLQAACRQISAWQATIHENVSVSVNLSAMQFHQHNLLEQILLVLTDTEILPSQLELEITESTVMADIDAAAATMRELHCSGLRISIDDFGTGYSSLNQMKHFPINTIKIDRSFIRDISTDSDDAAIVGAIITMAHSMGLKVIAEGVETDEQLSFLRKLRCDEIQGFLFCPPLPAVEAGKLLGQNIATHLHCNIPDRIAS